MSTAPKDPVTAEAPPERDRDFEEMGAELVRCLYAATKLGGMWGYDGRVSHEAITGLVAALREHNARSGDTSLRVVNEQLFLDGQRLRMESAQLTAFRYISELFATLDIGELQIAGTVAERDVIGLLKAINSVTRESADPRADLEAFLFAEGVNNVTVAEPAQSLETSDPDAPVAANVRDLSIEAYFRAMFTAWQLTADAAAGKVIEVRKAKRAIHDVVDLLARDEKRLTSLTQVKNFGEFRATHAANTAVLSLLIGRRLDLSKSLLGELGVAALLHDIGRPKPGDEDESSGSADHAARGARLLMPGMGYGDGSLRLVIAASRHHEPCLGTDARPAALLHRVIRVADFYDTATTPAGEGVPAVPTSRVLPLMLRDAQRFDPRIVKILAGILGRHPLGTVVQLDSGETAVVCGMNPHFDSPSRPIVRVITDADGAPSAQRLEHDLSKWERGSRKFSRTIVATCPPCEAFERPADYVRVI